MKNRKSIKRRNALFAVALVMMNVFLFLVLPPFQTESDFNFDNQHHEELPFSNTILKNNGDMEQLFDKGLQEKQI